MPWLATCPHETVRVLANELSKMGILKQEVLHRGILFECELEQAYRAHLLLRTASRIQVIVCQFKFSTLADFERELKKIQWDKWLRSHRPFKVVPTLVEIDHSKIKIEEIVNCFVRSVEQADFPKTPPKFEPKDENSITLVPFIKDNQCVLGIDTAGRALHKRGWRTNGHPAVLKETLAASILALADYNGSEILLDPMCGSGTIVIEAAYIALNKAPLIHRGKDDFALEHMAGFDRQLWRKISDQLRQEKKSSLPAAIFAADIEAKFVEVAKAGALRARVEKYLDFKVSSFLDLPPPAQKGLLITNLPYGERIGRGQIEMLYQQVGNTIEKKFSDWRVALLVPSDSPIPLLQLKFSRTYDLFNGALQVKLLIRD